MYLCKQQQQQQETAEAWFISFPLLESVCEPTHHGGIPNIQAIGISVGASSIGYLLPFPLSLLLLSLALRSEKPKTA